MSNAPLFLVLVLATGCAVGPSFVKPALPGEAGYGPAPEVGQRLVPGRDLPGDWWTLFHSSELDGLVAQSLKANPDLKAAQAALQVARENRLAQRGAYFPSVSASFAANRARTSADLSPVPNSGALIYNLYTPQVAVSFAPDVFGLNRRTVETLKAQEEQARFALAATHITLSANVAVAAIQEACLEAQVQATRESLAANTRMLEVLETQFAKGYVSRLDVAAQESQLAQMAATLPPLLKQQAQQRDLVAALTGRFPGQAPQSRLDLDRLELPQDLPLSLPAQVVAQRPDVRQAEENLHAACAQVGVAAANRLPSLTLSADAGSMALATSRLFHTGTGFWDLGLGIVQPVFQGGTLSHREKAARAAWTQAAEQYRSTVLAAFQNVADTLAALQQDAGGLKAAQAARDAAALTLDLTRKQLQAGYVTVLALLNAQQAYQQALLNLAQAKANRLQDTAALFQALGGGWWNRPDLPKG